MCNLIANSEKMFYEYLDFNDSYKYNERTLSTISEIDDDAESVDDLLNSSCESSEPSTSSGEWKTETWPWFQSDWYIFITNPKSTTEVWARLIGLEYSDALDSLTAKITLANKHRPSMVSTNEIYVTFASGQWHRVRTLKLTKSNYYECFLIDSGEEYLIPLKSLYVCETIFRELLPQALCFTLSELSDYAKHPHANVHLKELLKHKVVVASILTSEMEYSTDSGTPSKIHATFYNTSNPHNDINMNKLLMEKITEGTQAPKLESIAYGKICHVSKTGKIYLHLMENDLKYINNLIEEIVIDPDRLERAQATSTRTFSQHLYLVYDEFNKHWYRANIISNGRYGAEPAEPIDINTENPDDDTVITADKNHRMNNVRLCFCIDFGITKAIKLSNIYNLHSLSVALYKYPCQAIALKLNHLPMFSAYVLTRLRCICDVGTNVIVKAVSLDTLPPIVDIYKRDVPDNNNLMYINEWIAKEEELQKVGIYLDLNDSFTFDD